jgi:hypothetical protein
VIHIAETLAIGSVEGFLTEAERGQLTTVMDRFLSEEHRAQFGTGRSTSIHEIPGHSAEQAWPSTSPAGGSR